MYARSKVSLAILMLLVGCGDDGGDDGDGGATESGDGGNGAGGNGDSSGGGGDGSCGSLCTGAGFAAGEEMNFGEVIECVCSGSGSGIAQADCSSYCSAFQVTAERSYLSMQTIMNDKCVCDGT